MSNSGMKVYLDAIGRSLRDEVLQDPASAVATETVTMTVDLLRGLAAQSGAQALAARYTADTGPLLGGDADSLPATRRRVGQLIEDLDASGDQSERIRALAVAELAYLTAFQAINVPPDPLPGGKSMITPDRLAAYLDHRFPDEAPFTVQDLVGLPGGGSKNTWLVRLGREASFGSDIVLRQDVDANFLGNDLGGEFGVLTALADTSLPVARPIAFETNDNSLGNAFILSTRMPGKNVGDLWGFAGDIDGSSIALQLAAVLARLHQIDFRRLKPFSGAAGKSGPDLVRAHIEDFERRWRQQRSQSSPTIALGLRWLYRNIDPGTPAAIVHGDAALSNVLVADGHISGLLDWEFAHLGDPAEDLAYIRGAMEAVVPWETFLAAYAAAGGTVPSESRLRFGEIWRLTRHVISCVLANDAFYRGDSTKLRGAAAGMTHQPMLELLLLRNILSDL